MKDKAEDCTWLGMRRKRNNDSQKDLFQQPQVYSWLFSQMNHMVTSDVGMLNPEPPLKLPHHWQRVDFFNGSFRAGFA